MMEVMVAVRAIQCGRVVRARIVEAGMGRDDRHRVLMVVL